MTSLRRALVAIGIAAVVVGIASLAIILTSNHTDSRGLAATLILLAGWGFVGTGLYAWDRRPGNATGALMTAVGFTWFFQAFSSSNNVVVFTVGALGSSLPFAVLVHLLVTFPSGRLRTTAQKAVVAGGYFVTTVWQLAWGLFIDPEADGCDGCPENPLLITSHSTLGDIVVTGQVLFAIAVVASAIVIVIRHWRGSEPRERRALSPVVLTGAVAFGLLLAQLVASQLGLPHAVEQGTFIAAVAAFACLPFAFLFGLLRSRIGRDEETRTRLTAENEQLNAELRAKVEQLRASRTRIVEAGYDERRRVERNLHDGAQQRLVALTMSLRLVRGKIESEPEAATELLDEAMTELGEATKELRELARGIHPAVLSDRGLEAALGGLAERSPLPVEVTETPAERLPAPVETASYFVVAEALTNVARYAEAESATVRIARHDGTIEVEVSDDGIGGADPAAGTGLRGLADRVAALDGELRVESPAGGGTTVVARIPCA